MPDGGMRYPSVAPVARRRSPASGCGGFFDGGMYNDNANAKQQHARRPRDEGVASAARYERPSPSFLRLLTYCPRDLGAFGDGAPPQARRHLNLDDNISGSPRTKFGYCVTVCNRRFQRWQPIIGARPRTEARCARVARGFPDTGHWHAYFVTVIHIEIFLFNGGSVRVVVRAPLSQSLRLGLRRAPLAARLTDTLPRPHELSTHTMCSWLKLEL